jgi:hypothetical protein
MGTGISVLIETAPRFNFARLKAIVERTHAAKPAIGAAVAQWQGTSPEDKTPIATMLESLKTAGDAAGMTF